MGKRALTIGLLLVSLTPALGQDDIAAGEALFAGRCQVCHAIGEGAETASKVGPHLNGIVGAPMAATPGYLYSPVLRAAAAEGRVWTITDLRRFINRPKKLFPGTKMTFGGQSDPVDLGNLVAYLASFAADGTRIEPAR
jgi:cytochrome c